MKNLSLIVLALGLGILACQPAAESQSPPADPPPPAVAVEQVPFTPDLIRPEMVYTGTREQGIAWTDATGLHVALFTRETVTTEEPDYASSVTLRVYHYRVQGETVERLREVRDFTLDCEFDNMAAFVPAAVGVTDLDANGQGELSFAYYLGCTSDVSPLPFKLLLLEGGSKYIIRGAVAPAGMEGGEQVPDPAFATAPAAFLAHAQQMWTQVGRYPGE